MIPIFAQIAPTEVPGLAVKILAVLGGALVGGLLLGFLARVAVKLLTTRPLPLWALRFLRLLGGVAGGWLVALFVFGGGGSGLGGSGGGLFPGGGQGSPDTRNNEKQPEDPKQPPKPPEKGNGQGGVVQVAVLGDDTLRALFPSGFDPKHTYRIEGEEKTKVFDLEGIKNELLERKKAKDDLQVQIVLYLDSPIPGNDYVKDLTRKLKDHKLLPDSPPAPHMPQQKAPR